MSSVPCCLQLGDIFTIHVAGKYMTFVTDPEDFPLFFQNKNVDFQEAVQPYTMGVGVCVCVCVCMCVCVCARVCMCTCKSFCSSIHCVECANFIFVICSCHHIALLFNAANIT